MLQRLFKYFKEELWIYPSDGSFLSKFFRKILRITIATIQGFYNNECFLKASALTYYSLLSIVPVLAVAFGIAKGFGFDHRLQEEVLVQFHEQPDIARKIIDFSYSLLEHTKGGLIAGIGGLGLFYTVIKLLESIELALNSIWHVNSQRPWTRRVSDYLATMIFCPFFFVVASSITIYFTTLITKVTRQNHLLDFISPLIFLALNVIPYVFSWLLFAFIYLFMPNTKVSWKAGLIAGIIAGTAYQFLQMIYINLQVVVSNYNTIYGSFAALPLFLVWLNWSWLIVLSGAEIAYNLQKDSSNKLLAEYSKSHGMTSIRLMGLFLVWHCVQAFQKGNPPIMLSEMAKSLGVSIPFMQEIADDLVHHKVLSEVHFPSNEEEGYQPARTIKDLTIKSVCDALDKSSRLSTAIYLNPELSQIEKYFNQYEDASTQLSLNTPLIEIPLPLTSDNQTYIGKDES
jgi:membrane protein